MYEAVAGYRPLTAACAARTTWRSATRSWSTPPYEMPEGIPHEVEKILWAALEPNPDDRPLPHEFAEALEPVMARQPKARFAGFTTR